MPLNPAASNPPDSPSHPDRRRVVQNRILTIFAICSTVAFVFCCVPLVILNYVFGPTTVKEPAKVLAVAQKIAPIAIPPEFTGVLARSADNSLWNVQIACFDQNEGRGKLIIGALQLKILPPGVDDAQHATMLKTPIDELYPGMRLLDVKKSRKTTVRIQGQRVTFEITSGEDRASTTSLTQVTGSATGPQGAVQLVLQVESDFITDEAIDALLRSLEDPDQKPAD